MEETMEMELMRKGMPNPMTKYFCTSCMHSSEIWVILDKVLEALLPLRLLLLLLWWLQRWLAELLLQRCMDGQALTLAQLLRVWVNICTAM